MSWYSWAAMYAPVSHLISTSSMARPMLLERICLPTSKRGGITRSTWKWSHWYRAQRRGVSSQPSSGAQVLARASSRISPQGTSEISTTGRTFARALVW